LLPTRRPLRPLGRAGRSGRSGRSARSGLSGRSGRPGGPADRDDRGGRVDPGARDGHADRDGRDPAAPASPAPRRPPRLRHRRRDPEGNPTGGEKRRHHACSPHLFLLSTCERSKPMAERGAVCSHEQRAGPASVELAFGWLDAGAGPRKQVVVTSSKNRVPLRTAMNKTSISWLSWRRLRGRADGDGRSPGDAVDQRGRVHGGAGHQGRRGLQGTVRRLPRRQPRGQRADAAARRQGFPRELAGQDGGRSLREDADLDARHRPARSRRSRRRI
jgi:hypothetical protein